MIKKSLKFFSFLGFFISVFFIISSSKVSAAAPITSPTINNTAPTTSSGVFNSTNVTPFYTVGYGGYPYGKSYFSILADRTKVSSFVVTIQNAGAGCSSDLGGGVYGPDFGGATTNFHLYSNSFSQTKSGGAGCGDISFSINTAGSCSQYSANTNFCEYLLDVFLDPGSSERENAFRITSSNSNVMIGVNGNVGDWAGYGYRSGSLNLGNHWGFEVMFGVDNPVCTGSTPNSINGTVKYFDSDSANTSWNDNLLFRMWQQPVASDPSNASAWQQIQSYSQAQIPDATGSFAARSFSPNYRYMVTFENIGTRNTLMIKLPPGMSQVGAKRNTDFKCTQSLDLCLNIPGDQNLAWITQNGYVKDTPGSTPGNCSKGGGCTGSCAEVPNTCSFDRPSVVDVQLGYPYSFGVRATNGGNTVWDKTTNKSVSPWHITAFMTQNNPSPYVAYVAKFGETVPALSQYQTSPFVNIPVNTSVPGTQVFNYYLVWLDTYNPVTQPFNYIQGGPSVPSCTMTINVIAPTPTGSITSANCNNVTFSLGWASPWPGNPAIHYRVSVEGSGVEGDGYGTVTRGTLTDINTSAPLHLPGYSVSIEIRNADGTWQPPSFYYIPNSCLTPLTCSPSSSWEYDPKTPYSFSFSISNISSRNDSRYTLVISSPPGGSRNGMNVGTNTYSASFLPDRTMDIVGTLNFAGSYTGINASCHVSVNRYPYIKAYGGSVISGGSFKPNCTTNLGGIFTRMRAIGSQPGMNESGSGSQLISLSNTINGFASGTIGNGNPNPVPGQYLSPGGRASIPGGSTQQLMAQNYNTSNYCLPDYWGMQYPDGDPRKQIQTVNHHITGSLPLEQNTAQQLYRTSSFGEVVEIPQGSDGNAFNNYNGRRTYFIDGDLHIERDVNYSNMGGGVYPNMASIPNLTFVVKGNIYITSNVTRLDGVYIAQPDSTGDGGVIYTCAEEDGVGWTNSDDIYRECRAGYSDGDTSNQLVFNGAVIAKSIVLNRAVRTLADSTWKEASAGTRASEVFNFSPELYLSSPIFNTNNSSKSYDSLGILPPML